MNGPGNTHHLLPRSLTYCKESMDLTVENDNIIHSVSYWCITHSVTM